MTDDRPDLHGERVSKGKSRRRRSLKEALLALGWSLAVALAAYGLWSLAWVVSEVVG